MHCQIAEVMATPLRREELHARLMKSTTNLRLEYSWMRASPEIRSHRRTFSRTCRVHNDKRLWAAADGRFIGMTEPANLYHKLPIHRPHSLQGPYRRWARFAQEGGHLPAFQLQGFHARSSPNPKHYKMYMCPRPLTEKSTREHVRYRMPT